MVWWIKFELNRTKLNWMGGNKTICVTIRFRKKYLSSHDDDDDNDRNATRVLTSTLKFNSFLKTFEQYDISIYFPNNANRFSFSLQRQCQTNVLVIQEQKNNWFCLPARISAPSRVLTSVEIHNFYFLPIFALVLTTWNGFATTYGVRFFFFLSFSITLLYANRVKDEANEFMGSQIRVTCALLIQNLMHVL